jgi:hypothetical protein
MHDAAGIMPHFMNGRMDREAGGIDRIRGRRQGLAVKPDLDETRGGDLVESHPIGIDEKLAVRSRQARGNMGEDQVIPLVQRSQTITGGEIDAHGPFGIGHYISDDALFRSGHYSSLPFLPMLNAIVGLVVRRSGV